MFASNTSQVANDAVFIEDTFACHLYTGNDSTQTITNGIDLSTKGGLVWIKSRNLAGTGQFFQDTVRGANQFLDSTTTGANQNIAAVNTTFSTTGFSQNNNYLSFNGSGYTYVSWTFRKQPKFFDVVTYTGTGSVQNISHNLGSTPACMIVKDTTNAGSAWAIYHTSLGNTQYLQFTTAAAATSSGYWNNTSPTSTQFTVGTNGNVNQSGATYVAYLFAHNAGGFGLTGTDNVISCGSFTTDSGGNFSEVNLGYEPQWLLIKNATTALGFTDWRIVDNMRGFTTSTDAYLAPNTSAAEASAGIARPTATGFAQDSSSVIREDTTYIYIAIRRGPMKVPTSGTSVFSPVTYTGNGSTRTYSVGFPTDLSINMNRNSAGDAPTWNDRLRGSGFDLYSNSTGSEQNNGSAGVQFDNQTNIVVPSYRITNGTSYIDWCMRRAPSFFDEVCYTGTGSVLSLTHNLGVAPEFILIKCRSGSSYWILGSNFGASTYALKDDWGANASNASRAYSSTVGFNAQPTATTVSLSTNSALNVSGSTYAMWMWATCAGVSKVGTYTGTGALQTINCGFTSGARFVLITRIGVVGDVNTYVYDSARGITSSNDPYLLLESTAAEVTSTNYVDTTSTGFQVTAAASSTINVSGGTYIFLAIA